MEFTEPTMESAMGVVKDKPSVFTLVMTDEPNFMDRHIAVIIDRKERKDTYAVVVVYKKFQGGGVKGDETPEVAACHETKEEIGLRGINPTERILEVHKVSRADRSSIHRDIFFVSNPVKEMRPLKPEKEEEIEYAGWEKTSWVYEQIRNGKFIPNHAYAFIWFMVREEFLLTRDTKLIQAMLSDRGLCSINIEKKKLVLCFVRNCPECRNKPGIAALIKNGKNSDTTPKPPCVLVEGETYFVLLNSTYLDDYLLFRQGAREGSYYLPKHVFQKSVSKEDALGFACENFGGAYELVAYQKMDRETTVVLRNISSPSAEFSLVPMNRAPNTLFSMPFKDWQHVLAAIPLLERYRYTIGEKEFQPMVNRSWKITWRDRVEN